MATREELIKQAQEKWERDQLIQEAQIKFAGGEPKEAQAETGVSLPEKIETGARSYLEGLTPFGISEPLISNINAGISRLIEEGSSSKDIAEAVANVMSAEAFSAEKEKDIARRRELKAKLPEIATGAEIAGGISSIAIPAVGLGKAVSAIPTLAQKVAAKVPTAAGKAAVTGGIVGTGEAAGRKAVLETTGFVKPEEALPVTEAGEAGALLGGGLSLAGTVGKGILKTPGKLLSAFGGVKASVIEDYLKRDKPLDFVSLDDLKATTDTAIERIKNTLVSQRYVTSDLLLKSVLNLKNKISADSTAAFSILDREAEKAAKAGITKTIKADDLFKKIDDSINEIAPEGKGIGAAEKTAITRLQDLKADFLQSPLIQNGEIQLADAKSILMSLDKITKYEQQAGTYTDDLNYALQAIRSGINKSLRGLSPEYGAHMDKLSADTRLLRDVNRYFGNPEQAFNNLKRLESSYDQNINSMVQRLEASTGTSIFPELNKIKRMASVESVTPATTEGFLKSVMRGNSLTNRRKLMTISQLADEDLVKMAQEAGMSAEFEKIVQNGSRDVVFWQTLLGGVSGAVGGGLATESAAGSMVGGAVVGYLVKTYGAPMTKQILDGVIKIKGIPTVKALNAALPGVPPKVRQDLITGFVRANTMRLAADPERPITIDPDMVDEIKTNVISSDLSSLMKAKALSTLSRDQTISNGIMREIMVGKEHKPKGMEAKKKAADLAEDEVGK